MRIRVGTWNAHSVNRDPRRGIVRIFGMVDARGWSNLDALAIQEGMSEKTRDAVRSFPLYRGLIPAAQGEAGLELPTMVRWIYKPIAAFAIGSRRVAGNPRNHADRGIHTVTWSRGFRGRHMVALVNTHLPVRTRESRREYAQHVERVLFEVTELRGDGYAVILGADANSTDADPRGLQAALRSVGFRAISNEVCCLAWDPQRLRLLDDFLVPAAQTGSDHDAIIAKFKHRRKP